MASSSGGPGSLVVLHFHDFHTEWMRHWWDLLEGMDRALIKGVFGKFSSLMQLRVDHGLLEALASFWDPTHCCFSIGEMDLVPTLEERAGLGEIPSQCLQDRLRSSSNYGSVVICGISASAKLLTTSRGVHCFDGMPPPGVWGYAGYFPNLALRQFGGLQYLPHLGDLSLVMFDYVAGSNMWKLLSTAKKIWGRHFFEMVFVEDGLPADSSVTVEFVEWREGWNPSFIPRPIIQPDASHPLVPPSLQVSAPAGRSGRVVDLERELDEARVELVALHFARVSEKESATHVESMQRTLHHSNAAMANLRLDLEAQKGNASILQEMNDFLREQLEISKGARDHPEQALTNVQGQLEALVDPSTGRPHDIVHLQRSLDESEAALSAARTSMRTMRLSSEGLAVARALHRATRVVESLGTEAHTVLKEYKEGDPILSTSLGRFCMETCIRLDHL
uniref:DUF7745 domain-containing protein n=1 Tax=Fagus sylvatica TaxID=28930 RepID=A0A2N9FEB2_FAGSY